MVRINPPKNKQLFIVAIAMIVAGLGFLGAGIYQVNSAKKDEASNVPNFKPVTPHGKSIDNLGGWQKVTTPNNDVFYAYVDTINGVTVNISQQQLPGKFKADVSNKMLEMARAYNANVKLDVDGIKVYIGTSAKGPQSVLLTKDGVLILMKSWSTIPDSDWTSYIKSLE